jgi:hypothetical protein
MPTGTSTIFGAFQAILALLLETGRTSALPIKVARQEKFASEIFSPKPQRAGVANAKVRCKMASRRCQIQT